jgi:hypothetical protein
MCHQGHASFSLTPLSLTVMILGRSCPIAAGRTMDLAEARLLAEAVLGAYVCRRAAHRLRRAGNNRASRQVGVQGLIGCEQRPKSSDQSRSKPRQAYAGSQNPMRSSPRPVHWRDARLDDGLFV